MKKETPVHLSKENVQRNHDRPRPGRLFVVGSGPGGALDRTRRAEEAIAKSTVVAGYTRYLELIRDLTEGKELIATGMTREEAIEHLVTDRLDKARLHAQIRARNAEDALHKEVATEANRVMAVAVDRHSGAAHLDRVQNAIPLPDPRTLSLFADPEGEAHKAFCAEIGCELVCDESLGTATVRGDDPLGREVARRVLRQIANRAVHSPERIRALANQVREELDREVRGRLKNLREGTSEWEIEYGRLIEQMRHQKAP